MEAPNVKANTSLVVPEGIGEAEVGLFLVPSTSVPGRSDDISGYLVASSNEYGKFEYIDPFELFSLNDLSDVTISDPINDNHAIQYDNNNNTFVNQELEFPQLSLDDLTDVNIVNPLENNVIRFDTGTNTWNNETFIATTDDTGIAELATQTEVENNTGGDRVVTSDVFNGIMGVNLFNYLGIELVASTTATNSPSVELTWTNDGQFLNYFCILNGVLPSVDGSQLLQRISQDGGATWESGVSDYESNSATVANSATTSTNSTISSSIHHTLGTNVSNTDAGNALDQILFLSTDPNSSVAQQSFISMSAYSNDGISQSIALAYTGSEYSANTNEVNGIQWFFDTGNISGTFSIYRF